MLHRSLGLLLLLLFAGLTQAGQVTPSSALRTRISRNRMAWEWGGPQVCLGWAAGDQKSRV